MLATIMLIWSTFGAFWQYLRQYQIGNNNTLTQSLPSPSNSNNTMMATASCSNHLHSSHHSHHSPNRNPSASICTNGGDGDDGNNMTRTAGSNKLPMMTEVASQNDAAMMMEMFGECSSASCSGGIGGSNENGASLHNVNSQTFNSHHLHQNQTSLPHYNNHQRQPIQSNHHNCHTQSNNSNYGKTSGIINNKTPAGQTVQSTSLPRDDVALVSVVTAVTNVSTIAISTSSVSVPLPPVPTNSPANIREQDLVNRIISSLSNSFKMDSSKHPDETHICSASHHSESLNSKSSEPSTSMSDGNVAGSRIPYQALDMIATGHNQHHHHCCHQDHSYGDSSTPLSEPSCPFLIFRESPSSASTLSSLATNVGINTPSPYQSTADLDMMSECAFDCDGAHISGSRSSSVCRYPSGGGSTAVLAGVRRKLTDSSSSTASSTERSSRALLHKVFSVGSSTSSVHHPYHSAHSGRSSHHPNSSYYYTHRHSSSSVIMSQNYSSNASSINAPPSVLPSGLSVNLSARRHRSSYPSCGVRHSISGSTLRIGPRLYRGQSSQSR